MINHTVPRLMQLYFLVYFGIAAGQFVMFSFMRSIGPAFFAAAILWLALLVWLSGRLPQRRAWIVLTVVGLIAKGLWIFFVQTPAVSDFSLMYKSAREIMSGGSDYLNNIYYQRFPYQIGFTSYQALIMSIVDSVSFLKLVNACWCAVASLAVYGIAREVFDRKVAVAAMLLHVTLLPILALTSVLTNQHIAVAWLYVGLYVWLKAGSRAWPWAIAAGACLAVGHVMRPIGIVVIAAIAVNALIRWGLSRSKRDVSGLVRAGAAIAAYYAVIAIVAAAFSHSGLSPDGLRNNDPLWKLVAGLNAMTNGGYSAGDERLLNYGYMDPERRSELEKQIIMERLTSPRNMLKLPFVKIGKMWADYQPDWFTFPRKTGTTFNYLGWPVSFDDAITRYRHFERAVFYLLAIAAFVGVLRALRSDFGHDGKRLLILIVGAYTFVHLFAEVQSRYLYFLLGIVVTFGAAELLKLRDRLVWRDRLAWLVRPAPPGSAGATDRERP